MAFVLGASLGMALATGAVHPVDLLLPGRAGPSEALIREDFPDVRFRSSTGYDGQQIYAIARSFPHLRDAEPSLGAPRYRATRILMPALASIAGRGTTLVLLLLLWGLVGCGLAVAGLADLAAGSGRDTRIGLLALPPLMVPLLTSTVEPLAFGLAFAGLAFLARGRVGVAAVAFGLAALTRETAAGVAIFAGAGLAIRGEWRAGLLCAGPAVVLVAGWYIVLGHLVATYGAPEVFTPLAMVRLAPDLLLLAVAVMAVSAAGGWLWRDVPIVWPVAVGFGGWILVYPADTLNWLALPRVSAPAVALGLAGLAQRWLGRRTSARAENPGRNA